MSKLNLEKKAEIVAHYLNTSDGYTNTANIFGISESVVKMLVGCCNTIWEYNMYQDLKK